MLFFPEHMGGDLLFVLMVTRVCVVFCFLWLCALFKQRPKGIFEDFVSSRRNILES